MSASLNAYRTAKSLQTVLAHFHCHKLFEAGSSARQYVYNQFAVGPRLVLADKASLLHLHRGFAHEH